MSPNADFLESQRRPENYASRKFDDLLLELVFTNALLRNCFS